MLEAQPSTQKGIIFPPHHILDQNRLISVAQSILSNIQTPQSTEPGQDLIMVNLVLCHKDGNEGEGITSREIYKGHQTFWYVEVLSSLYQSCGTLTSPQIESKGNQWVKILSTKKLSITYLSQNYCILYAFLNWSCIIIKILYQNPLV